MWNNVKFTLYILVMGLILWCAILPESYKASVQWRIHILNQLSQTAFNHALYAIESNL